MSMNDDDFDFNHEAHTEAQWHLDSEDGYFIVIVEGETEDRYFRQIFDKASTTIIIANGRDNTTHITNKLSQNYPNEIVGICDQDLLDFGIGSHTGTNIYHTDKHDLEMDALYYGNFKTWLNQNCNHNKLGTYSIQDIIDLTLELCSQIGYIRLVNERDNKKVSFDSYNLSKKYKSIGIAFQNQHPFTPNTKNIIDRILISNNTSMLQLSGYFVQEVNALLSQSHDLYMVCNGHDFGKILLRLLKAKFGSNEIEVLKDEKKFVRSVLLDSLVGSYPPDKFYQSQLGQALQANYPNQLLDA